MSQATAPAGSMTADQFKNLSPAEQWEFEQTYAIMQKAATDAYNAANLAQQHDVEQGRLDQSAANLNATQAANRAALEVQYAFDVQKTNADNRMKVLDLMSKLTGPRNAFIQQAVVNGLNKAGLSNAVDWISGKTPGVRVQGSQATPQPLTLESFLADNGLTLPGEIKAPTFAPLVPVQAPRLPPSPGASLVNPSATAPRPPAPPSTSGTGPAYGNLTNLGNGTSYDPSTGSLIDNGTLKQISNPTTAQSAAVQKQFPGGKAPSAPATDTGTQTAAAAPADDTGGQTPYTPTTDQSVLDARESTQPTADNTGDEHPDAHIADPATSPLWQQTAAQMPENQNSGPTMDNLANNPDEENAA